MPKPLPTPYNPSTTNAHKEEEEKVHDVYEAIAPHFSQTRFKPWPLIRDFLIDQPPGSLGLDSGAGNGKYLPVAHSAGCEMVALDRSSGLLSIARTQGWGSEVPSPVSQTSDKPLGLVARHEEEAEASGERVAECVRADMSSDCWRAGVFDFAISIAAVHHLATAERRQQAVQVMLRPLRVSATPPFARFMIYVWAYEQGNESKRRMGRAVNSSAIGVHTADSVPVEKDTCQGEEEIVQDVLVPWVLAPKKGETTRKAKSEVARPPKAIHPRDPRYVAPSLSPSSYSSNISEQAVAEPAKSEVEKGKEKEPETEQKLEEPKVFHRYYHLFTRAELLSLVQNAAIAEGFALLPSTASSVPPPNALGPSLSPSPGLAVSLHGLSLVNGKDVPEQLGEEEKGEKGQKWARVRGIGWEADNWWIEGEVGVF